MLSGCFDQEQHILWKELEAPGGKLRIEYGPPPAYGSHTLYFSYLPDDGSEVQQLGKKELNNDGANLGDHNLEVLEKTPNSLEIVLHGQQQGDNELLLQAKEGKATLLSK